MNGTDDDYLIEHSLDLRVNSYAHRATEPGYKVGDGETNGGGKTGGGGVPVAVRPYCLAVKNVPTGLTRTGLYNIFSQFGDLLECQLGGDRGKVSYSNGVQAATAIAQLDRKEPYRMVVDWQVDREIREKKQIIEDEEKNFAEQINAEFDQFVASEIRWNSEDVSNRNVASQIKDNPDLDIVGNDTKPPAQVLQSTCPVYQYNQPLSVSPPTAGLCSSCSMPGILLCSVCKAWYCSALCQRDHWYLHKRYCGGKPPPLEIINDRAGKNSAVINVLESSDTKQLKVDFKNANKGMEDVMNVAQGVAKPEEVVVSFLRTPADLCIQAVPSLSLLSCMMVELQSPTYHTTHPASISQDNTMYLAKCEGVWYRVRVISISPTQTNARVILVDYGNTDIVEVESLRTLPVHKAVEPLARRVQLVNSNMDQEWDREELARLREIVGEGDGVKFKLDMTEVDGTMRLVDTNGKNVLDIWNERNSEANSQNSIAATNFKKFTKMDGSVENMNITADAINKHKGDHTFTHRPLIESREMKSEDIPQLNNDGLTGNPFLDQISRKIVDNPAKVNIVGSNSSSQSDKEPSSNSNQNFETSATKEKIAKFSKKGRKLISNDMKGSNEAMRKPNINQICSKSVKSSSTNSNTFHSASKAQYQNVDNRIVQNISAKSVLENLTAGSRVELLKITADPWSNFRSICVREIAENKDADWVLGGLQVEGGIAEKLNCEAGIGEIVVAWNKDDQMFYRVVVINKEHVDGVLRYYTLSMDFGREVSYASGDLRKSWASVNKYCALGIIVKCETNLSKDVVVELNRSGRDGISMEVISCSKNEAVLATKVKGRVFRWKAIPAIQDREKIATNLSMPPPPLPPAPAPVPLPPGLHKVLLLSAESPALIYICTFSQYNLLTTTMVPSIQAQAETSHPVSVVVHDSLVLASYGDMWHRAKLDLISHNNMVARLLDLGHSIPVTKDQLKLAEPIVRSWPAAAVPCVLAEWASMARNRSMLDSLKNTWSNFMKSLVKDFQELELRVLSVDEGGFHIVHIPAWENIVRRGQGSQS